jgi:hypothetical protein
MGRSRGASSASVVAVAAVVVAAAVAAAAIVLAILALAHFLRVDIIPKHITLPFPYLLCARKGLAYGVLEQVVVDTVPIAQDPVELKLCTTVADSVYKAWLLW